MIRSAFYAALAVAALLYLTSHVGQATPAAADLCPPAAHTTAGDECLPCTPERCRQPAAPATWIGCRVTLRVSRGDDYVQATGTLTTWNQNEGYELAELDGEIDRPGTGAVQYLTVRPPIELEVIRCPA